MSSQSLAKCDQCGKVSDEFFNEKSWIKFPRAFISGKYFNERLDFCSKECFVRWLNYVLEEVNEKSTV